MSGLQDFINSKEGKEQLNSIMSMLGTESEKEQENNTAKKEEGGTPDLSSVMSMLGSMLGGKNQETETPNIDINAVIKLQQIFSMLQKNDRNTELLLCLKPHFSKERQQKVDRAISMMRLFSMLPAIKESGLFGGL